MTLLLDAEALDARRSVARGTLAPLARGLRAELAPVLDGAIEIPREKALLSRTGGRCPRDGSFLRFDPIDPRHVCPACGIEMVGELHDRFRPYWYQLWLAERVLHAAVLGVLLDDETCIEAAWRVLDEYTVRYLEYPNRDNVLGPSRPFFSTYLESIWLLQLVLAVDLLETSDERTEHARGGRVRDRIVEPSARLIASYDESISNRQVWNDAAMLAAGTLLGDEALIDRSLDGASGLSGLLTRALLEDGSWYEGENYHLFAHRGLWYAITMAERLGRAPHAALTRRFDDGFAAPFRTILPDLTYPSRRDSQYAVSIRQPRFAESCELGLARRDDPRLLGMLARLYDPAAIARDTGRRASTADVERNVAATGLTRADLTWRSLLFAREVLPPLAPAPLESDLLPAQGIGILRREGGRCFVALDYGRSGGGHGHPDRLNLLLSDGESRWFDDPGTGSYVDESLHWYRSTLAHTAPLVDGRSQPRVDGELVAFQDGPSAGWMSATAELAPGCHVRRSVVVMDDYLIDRLEWESESEHELALPVHGVVAVDASGAPLPGEADVLEGRAGREDGFSFLSAAARLTPSDAVVRLVGTATEQGVSARLDGWLAPSVPATWWSAVAPGPPGREPQSMVLVRASAARGTIVGVWSWRGRVLSAEIAGDHVRVTRDGDEHRHAAIRSGWQIQVSERRTVTYGKLGPGLADTDSVRQLPTERAEHRAERGAPLALPFRAELGAVHYRRSEESWDEAGRPTCRVELAHSRGRLLVQVAVPRADRRFIDIDAPNPLDNDPAAIHGDGVQLYVDAGTITAGWLLVPIPDSSEVGARVADGWTGPLPLEATWRMRGYGYVLSVEVELPAGVSEIGVDVLVNEISPGRTRRRGQLVLSGARGEFVYLRADRHERERLLRFAILRD
ncbi:MAG TPA: heparinase II/III family protein [Gemmatimonadaceae bacterium]|nr:heparinase II/III family protein [Gemmatimonadaceae bacterium]